MTKSNLRKLLLKRSNSSVFRKMNISVNGSVSLSGINSVDSGKISKAIAYGCIMIWSIIGNSFMVWAIKRDIRLKTTTNLLICNMSISELINSFFIPPARIIEILNGGVWIWQGIFGVVMCKVLNFLPTFIIVVDVYSCMLISIDRYLAIARPLQGGFNKFKINYVIFGVWIFAFTFSLPYLYFMRVLNVNDKRYCVFQEEPSVTLYSIVFFVTLFALPMLIITFAYSLIVYKLRRHKVPGQLNEVVRRRREDQNNKIFKMSAAIVGLFYLSFLCGGIVVFLLRNKQFTSHLLFIASIILSLCGCSNFVITLVFNDFYRQNFKAFFARCHCCVVNVGGNVVNPGDDVNQGFSLRHNVTGSSRDNNRPTLVGVKSRTMSSPD